MAVEVTYGSFSFTGTRSPVSNEGWIGLPVPYVSRTQEMIYHGRKWCQVTTLTLDGSIVGSSKTGAGKSSFEQIDADRNSILNGFSKDHQTLTIKEDGSEVISYPVCLVDAVNFEAGNHGVINYSIILRCWEKRNFTGEFGVLDPVNTFTFTEEQDNFITIEREISARGFLTGDPNSSQSQYSWALRNAKNYVESLSGSGALFDSITPSRILGYDPKNIILDNVSQKVDRPTATYTITETYKAPLEAAGIWRDPEVDIIAGFFTRSNSSVESGVDDEFVNVSLEYTLEGGKAKTFQEVRDNLPTGVSLWKIATGILGSTGLHPHPVTFSVNEDPNSNSITLNSSFNNDTIREEDPNVYFDYKVSFDTDEVSSITSVTVDGKLKCRNNIRKKYNQVSGHYVSSIVGFDDGIHEGITGYMWLKANDIYTGLLGQDVWTLNSTPASLRVTQNRVKGEMGLSASFNNKDFLIGFSESNFSVSVTPSLPAYTARPSVNKNGVYGIYDLGVKSRQKVQLKGSFAADRTNEDYSDHVRDYILDAQDFYIGVPDDLVIENETIDSVPDPYRTLNFTYVYSYAVENPFHNNANVDMDVYTA
jgi:hypothetical protein